MDEQTAERTARRTAFRFIDPLLDCQQAETRQEVRPFRRELERLAEAARSGGGATHLSVYFRDLHNGAWVGINEKEEFLPASLLKVPLMMAVFHAEEERTGVLSEVLTVPADVPASAPQRYSKSSDLVAGSTHTVIDLVSAMARDSDNAALWTLLRRFGGAGIHEVYEDLGVLTPVDGVPDHLRVKDYASIFRLLYNASYLSRHASERALYELTQSNFGLGIVSPLPKDVKVAHKYGERDLGGEKQLHDCGIVYYPKQPYILCVMTRGPKWEGLADTIQKVSGLVYREISTQFPPR